MECLKYRLIELISVLAIIVVALLTYLGVFYVVNLTEAMAITAIGAFIRGLAMNERRRLVGMVDEMMERRVKLSCGDCDACTSWARGIITPRFHSKMRSVVFLCPAALVVLFVVKFFLRPDDPLNLVFGLILIGSLLLLLDQMIFLVAMMFNSKYVEAMREQVDRCSRRMD